MFKKILVTGGCGFIGSNFIRLCLEEREWEIVNLDALTYAGNRESLEDIEGHRRYSFVHGRIEDRGLVEDIFSGGVDGVVHFAAESHVDRSVLDASPFVTTNVLGTQILLDAARSHGGVKRFLHVSTDEVYGSLARGDAPFTEAHPLAPNSPYSASKASSDFFARAAWKTHALPVVITRCSNNYGPYQFPEKLIPLMIINAVNERPLPVYGDGANIRDWIFVEDHCRGVLAALERGRPGEVYNLGGECEIANIDIVRTILRILGKPESLIRYVKDRPGHDFRYAMDISKAKDELGWAPATDFESGIRGTVSWYGEHHTWWERILSGEYRKYYQRQYGRRLDQG